MVFPKRFNGGRETLDVGRTVTLTGILECVQRECRERVSNIRLLPFPGEMASLAELCTCR